MVIMIMMMTTLVFFPHPIVELLKNLGPQPRRLCRVLRLSGGGAYRVQTINSVGPTAGEI